MSTGYNDDAIIEKVIVAINSVLRGKKKYERDGSCFNSAPKTNKIRLILQEIIDQSTCIVDFGGGLGSTYVNNADILMGIKKYIVIEQYKFVAYGRELAKDYNLKISFQDNIKKIEEHPDIIIFSSVLQYLPNPYEVIEEANKLKPKYIIIDVLHLGI